MTAIEEIAAERRRQVEVEGWSPEHDDEHARGELARAAGCYAVVAGCAERARQDFPAQSTPYPEWPWAVRWWKPRTRRDDLIRAAALIVAEIERLDRLSTKGEERT